jgi:hypothetical protein
MWNVVKYEIGKQKRGKEEIPLQNISGKQIQIQHTIAYSFNDIFNNSREINGSKTN